MVQEVDDAHSESPLSHTRHNVRIFSGEREELGRKNWVSLNLPFNHDVKRRQSALAQLERMLPMKRHSISNAKKPSLRAARSGASRNTTRSQPRRCLLFSSGSGNLPDSGAGSAQRCRSACIGLVPEWEDSLAVLFRRVNGRYAQYLNAGRRRTGHLWQNRYFSCPVAAEKEEIVLGYTEWNPVRAAMVDKPEEYKWSSAAAHLVGPGAERIHLLDWTYWSNLGGAEEWK